MPHVLPAVQPVTVVVFVLLISVSLSAGFAVRGLAQSPSAADAAAAFGKIAAVLKHPRCLNCHQAETPRQGDAARAHVPRVARGPDNLGVSAMRCGNCHQETNTAASRVPGAPHWQLAPVSMTWQGLSDAALCAMLKDRDRNGGRSLDDLVEHMGKDGLVLWGWEPGAGREAVPVPHAEFMDLLRLWVAAGGACPA